MDPNFIKPLHEGRHSFVFRLQKGDEKFLVKQLHPRFNDSEYHIAQFKREALQQHVPGVTTKVLDYKEEDGSYYIIKEYIEGESLKKINEQFDGRKVKLYLRIYISILNKLQLLHDEGIVHGDIKPSNILVSGDFDGEGPDVFILDLGLAMKMENPPRRDESYPLPFSMMYGAPEVMLNEPDLVGPHSDTFSLAICLYESLVGKLPYDLQHPAMLMQLMLAQPIKRNKKIPPEVFAVVEPVFSKPAMGKPAAHYTRDEIRSILDDNITLRKQIKASLFAEKLEEVRLNLKDTQSRKPFWRK